MNALLTMHLPALPILLPFIAGLLLLALPKLGFPQRRLFSGLALLLQIGVALLLLSRVSGGDIFVYRLGDWAAPWGIVLVADRLSAWMLLITTVLALAAAFATGNGDDRRGPHFHTLFQMQLFGLAGAFLTGDLFNLFVFFEVLLLASYGLQLHGGGGDRVRGGLHYVVLNLIGSTVFLFAAGLLYGALGTLNMADLAQRAAQVPASEVGLVRTGGLLLFAVFALKAALLPLYFWLPAAYASTSAPVAALFAIMTKVGAYAILRHQSLMFGPDAGPVADLFAPWLLPAALLTLLLGMFGALAADRLKRMAAYLVVASVGTLLVAFSLGTAGVAAGLYYLPHSTFAGAALFLLADAIARRREVVGESLREADGELPQAPLWGTMFFVSAVLIAGLPPLSGFLGKVVILRAAYGQPAAVLIWTAILFTALLGIIAMARAGSRLFFKTDRAQPSAPIGVRRHDLLAIGSLLALALALTIWANPVLEFTQATATQLGTPDIYIRAVLGAAESGS
ncbi:MAG: monovalent cation/H+ antiporter subunit D [Chromatiales bacterium]|nr:monovalent cation/H+ antiporter subunit D [Gammaproteobacteria bacterium]MCP5352196.1 monovalent cation/H+ antiporter subunit D [Chromatiales bacterium]